MNAAPGKLDLIVCRACNGDGYEPLPATHARVLRVLEKSGSMTAPAIWSKLGERLGATAINNRLEHLRAWHYVGRMREGRTWMYWATTVRPPRPPAGSCPLSPRNKHQIVTLMVGEMRVVKCGVCNALSPDSD